MTEQSIPPLARDRSDAIKQVLVTTHRRSADDPLRLPSEDGLFPAAILTEPLCVVPDAHWLGFDVNYACVHNRRTTLVSAANRQLIRLFCAKHVVDEVVEHVTIWSADARRSVNVEDFLRRWHCEYVPMLRIVPDDAIPMRWLSPEEQERISELAVVDEDDIPSVKLALATHALYLSKDGPALAAIYGADAEVGEREKWLEHLQAGSDAGELARFIHGAGAFSYMTSYGAIKLGKKAYDAVGPAAVLVGAGLMYWLWDWLKHPARRTLRAALGDIATSVAEMELQRDDRQRQFDGVLPQIPTWAALAASNASHDIVGRAALYALARTPHGHASARELTGTLRGRVHCDETSIRTVLRSTPCFVEMNRGRWQVGSGAVPTTTRPAV